MRTLALKLSLAGAGLVLCLAGAEVALRGLPVSSGMPAVAVNARQPVFHFAPNREFLYSRDWDMIMANRGHVNNAGWVNDQDYRKDDPLPLLAVVGDSMIEALMVPYRDTLHGRLAGTLDGRLRVYSFGASGAPLSQYLIWARHAVREYGARAILVNVYHNDFDESLAAYKSSPGFWHYAAEGDRRLELRLFDFQPAPRARLVYASALARYLIFNVRVGVTWDELRRRLAVRPAPLRTRDAEADPIRVGDSLAAIDAFFRDLGDLVGLPPERIAFTVDGFRYPATAAARAGSYLDVMRRAFIARAVARGYEVIDLDREFFPRHERTGARFEFARDIHWNATGHQAAFEAVMSSRLMKRLLP